MTVTASELSITYNGNTYGGSSAREITGYTIDEHDFIKGSFEFEFITTATSDAAFATELDSVRNDFRTSRKDLVVTQNASTILSRKHSDNTGLNTFPHIIKDGDPADTGRSRHFRVRIEYELPADRTNTAFRRGSTITVAYSPSRRRTVTISYEYTANSTDGTTTADSQYFAQIATAEASILNFVDSAATWERVGQPQVEYFETRKVCKATRVYREVNIRQALGQLVDDPDIIDPHMEITVEQLAPGDSLESGLTFDGGGGGTTTTQPGIGSGNDPTIVSTPGAPGPTSGEIFGVTRPVLITINYDASINFDTTINQALQTKWTNTIRPWIIDRATQFKIASTLVIVDERPAYEIYENHIAASVSFIVYYSSITRQRITYRDITADGYNLHPTSEKDVFAYYEFPGPAVRQVIVLEDREQVVSAATTALSLRNSLYVEPGQFSKQLGQDWRKVSREPEVVVITQGLAGGTIQYLAQVKITTIFQYRKKKSPSIANAGGVTGSTLTT